MSLSVDGSVAITRSRSPSAISRILLCNSITGSGQYKPLASNSVSESCRSPVILSGSFVIPSYKQMPVVSLLQGKDTNLCTQSAKRFTPSAAKGEARINCQPSLTQTFLSRSHYSMVDNFPKSMSLLHLSCSKPSLVIPGGTCQIRRLSYLTRNRLQLSVSASKVRIISLA